MTKRLRTPDEPRFVHAFALAVDPGGTLGLLMEIGALGSPDIGIVRRTRKSLVRAYGWASDQKEWEQAHTIGILREALAQSDSAACPYIWPSRMEYARRLCPSFLTRCESPIQG